MRYLALIASLCACGDNGKHPVAVDAASPDAAVEPGPLAACVPSSGTRVTWRQVGTTDGPAIVVVSPPNDPRLFVVTDYGKIQLIRDHAVVDFLDLTNVVTSDGGEQGLLGLAFPPQYAIDGVLYVFYTTSDANVLARYHVMAGNPDKADPSTGEVVLSIPDFAVNHNGGMLEYGPDGDLYIGTGDGGGGGDPHLNGQNPHALLAKLLRISTHHETPPLKYSIPDDNPYYDGVAGAPEVYDIGFRNPWRYAFDSMTGDLWIGDVGQDAVEEIDLVPAGAPSAQNFGWSMYEGSSCYNSGNGNGTCSPSGITMPQYEALHTDGWCAIIGGDVYRGQCYPDLAGTYFFTDWCKAELHEATKTGAATFATTVPADVTYLDADGMEHDGAPPSPSSIHKAANGELYMTTTTVAGATGQGGIFRLEARP